MKRFIAELRIVLVVLAFTSVDSFVQPNQDDLFSADPSLLVNRTKRQSAENDAVQEIFRTLFPKNPLFESLRKELRDTILNKRLKRKLRKARRNSFSKILSKFNEPSYCAKKYWPEHEELLTASRILMRRKPNLVFTLRNLEALSVRMLTHKPTYLQENGRCKYYYDCEAKKNLKYRTMDGTCNNLNMPEFGAKDSPLKTHLLPAYDDKLDEPKSLSEAGGELPNPRVVSVVAADGDNTVDPGCSLMFMQWGQYMDHDMDLTIQTGEEEGEVADCTDCDSRKTVSDECWPFKVPENDPFFASTDAEGKPRCFDFIRSAGARDTNIRTQVNGITAYIDASNVYGSDDEHASDLRTFMDGKMKMSLNDFGEPILPMDETNEDCRIQETGKHCFVAGDGRSNEQLGLNALHSVMLNVHDKISTIFKSLNPQWGDNTIYQETRKVLAAINQQITYKEFLPILLGPFVMDSYGLRLSDEGFTQVYDDQCDASIANSFATACFRYAHSAIPEQLAALTVEHEGAVPTLTTIPLLTTFVNPTLMYGKGMATYLMLGMSNTSAGKIDSRFAKTIKDRLFEEPDKPKSGTDLFALNIQRGRDHGLPGYTYYREWCDGKKISTFDDLQGVMKPEKIEKLRLVYKVVQDIDLFMGGMAELPAPGAVVGPTFQCCIADQFERAKKCDRFWHELEGQFTEAQLVEVRKISLAWVICFARFDKSYDIPMHRYPMMMQSEWTTCSQILGPDFAPWREAT